MLPVLVLLALLLRVGLFIADVDAPVRTLNLRAQDITSATPGLYTVPVGVPDTWWRRARGDSLHEPDASTLALYEEGRALGPAHETHANIPGGGGRYSHWGEWLYFSTSDGSNPRTNGRAYSVEARLRVEPRVVRGTNLLLATSVMLIALARARAAVQARRGRFPSERYVTAIAAITGERLFGAAGGPARRRACGASGLLVALLTALAVCVPRQEFAVELQAVQAGNGRLRYVPVEVEIEFPFRIRSDSSDAPRASSLRLYADGMLLEPAHAEHSIIEADGAGHYSHWNGVLYFSSADGTEPASAKHRYTFSVKPSLMPGLLPGSVLLLLLLTSLAWPAPAAHYARVLITPAESIPARGWWATVGLIIAVCCAQVVWNWTLNTGAAPAPSIAGYLPVSDALGYNTCATQAAMLGRFTEYWEFCSRRTLYPSLLASFHLLTGSRLELILLVQAAVVACAIGVFVIRLAQVLSVLAALVAGALLFAYANNHVLGLLMTEFSGLVFGLLALSLFLGEDDQCLQRRVVLASAIISVALFSRNGAMFILPMLLVWVLIERRRIGGSSVLRLALAMATALAFGMLLQRALILMNGIEAASSFNNFSTVIYRLSIGAKDWSQALVDYPKLANETEAEQFSRIYRYALANIQAQPAVLLHSLGKALATYVHTLYQFVGNPRVEVVLSWLTLLGLVSCGLAWRLRTCRLIIGLAVCEIMSAPLIVEDGGNRLFAASIAVRIVLAVMGILFLLHLVARALPLQRVRPERLTRPFGPGPSLHAQRPELLLGMSLVALMFLPYSGILSVLLRPAPLVGSACPPDTRRMLIDVKHESFAIGSTDDDALGFSKPLVLSRKRLVSGVRATWYESEIASLPAQSLIIQAIDRSKERFGQTMRLWMDDGSALFGHPMPSTVCIVFGDERKLVGAKYQRIASVGPVISNPP